MNDFLGGVLAAALSCAACTASAGGLFYLGAGPADDASDTAVDEIPLAIGILGFSETSRLVFGADIAREGTMLDSTYGRNSLGSAMSFNALVGANLSRTEGMRIDAAAILGVRESFADCPDSFLGYQCYADVEPETDYEFNYGGLVAVSFGRASLGLRVTGESAQAIVGVNF